MARRYQVRHDGSHHGHQPKYHLNAIKVQARNEVIAAYRRITGRQAIPPDRNYWTLCNFQPDQEGSEIVQMVQAGLLTKRQFYGVDRDIDSEGVIRYNRSQHPNAHWFRGEWLATIYDNPDSFRPALVYFDSTQTIKTVVPTLAETMDACPPDTVLAANIMLNIPQNGQVFNPNSLFSRLAEYLRSPNWIPEPKCYCYRCSRTIMATYIFRRT